MHYNSLYKPEMTIPPLIIRMLAIKSVSMKKPLSQSNPFILVTVHLLMHILATVDVLRMAEHFQKGYRDLL